MSVENARCELGLFSFIADDTLYNSITDVATADSLIPWGKLYVPILVNTESFIQSVRAAFLSKVPHGYFVTPTITVTTTYQTYRISVTTTKYMEGDIYYYRTVPNLFYTGRVLVDGITGNGLDHYPVGIGRGANTIENIFFRVIIMNAARTSFKQANCVVSTLGFAVNDVSEIVSAPIISGYTAFFEDLTPWSVDNPYANGGVSVSGGGDGTFDFTSTDIPMPSLPSIGAYDTGFISMYKPTAVELKALASYLWSGSFDINAFKRVVAEPMDAIIGLHIIPTTPNSPQSASATLVVGNVSTGLSMNRCGEQYYELDCGTIDILPKWGAYLDYSPYSKLTLYLPYIGYVSISPDDCMNGSIGIKYHVDILSGTLLAFVYCVSNNGEDGHTLYTFSGDCKCEVPITSGYHENFLTGGLKMLGGMVSAGSGFAGVIGGLEQASNAALSMIKPDISRSGGFGSSSGLMGIQYPYLILTIPKLATPEQQNKYIGYPSFITKQMSELSGYTQIDVTHLDNMTATDSEVEEIIQLLKDGVIF